VIFSGRLQVPSEPEAELRVNLQVEAGRMALASAQQVLGTWKLDEVQISRLGGDRFAVTVAGEDLHFLADDTLSFAYSGLPALSRSVPVEGRKRRSWFGRMAERGRIQPEARWLAVVPDPDPEPVNSEEPDAGPSDRPANEATHLESPPVGEDPMLVAFSGDPWVQEIIDEPFNEVDENATDLATSLVDPEPVVEGDDAVRPFWKGRQRIIDIPDFVELGEVPVANPAFDASPTDDTAPPASVIDSAFPCIGVRADGLPCRTAVRAVDGYCFQHDPERTTEREVARQRAASAPRDPVARMRRDGDVRLARIFARLEDAMGRVERGELPAERAQALAQLAHTMVAILEGSLRGRSSADDESTV